METGGNALAAADVVVVVVLLGKLVEEDVAEVADEVAAEVVFDELAVAEVLDEVVVAAFVAVVEEVEEVGGTGAPRESSLSEESAKATVGQWPDNNTW